MFKQMFIKNISLLLLSSIFLSSSVNAAVFTYNDRATFENSFNTVVVDNLDGIKKYHHTNDIRDDYTLSTNGIFGCVDFFLCHIGTSSNLNGSYLVSYYGADTFRFNSPVYGFGFDFESPFFVHEGAVTINGQTSNSPSGFFGIISTQALNEFVFNQSNLLTSIDNITYSNEKSIVSVPEPSTFLLLAFGLLGLVLARAKPSKKNLKKHSIKMLAILRKILLK